MKNDIETIHARIRRLRRERGLTQQQVADHAGVNYQAVQNWEKFTAPLRETLPKVAEVFGVSVQYLLTGSNLEEPVESVRNATLKPIVDSLREAVDRLESLIEKPAQAAVHKSKLVGPGVLPNRDTQVADKLTKRRR